MQLKRNMEELYSKKPSFQYEVKLVHLEGVPFVIPLVARPVETATKSNALLHTTQTPRDVYSGKEHRCCVASS